MWLPGHLLPGEPAEAALQESLRNSQAWGLGLAHWLYPTLRQKVIKMPCLVLGHDIIDMGTKHSRSVLLFRNGGTAPSVWMK